MGFTIAGGVADDGHDAPDNTARRTNRADNTEEQERSDAESEVHIAIRQGTRGGDEGEVRIQSPNDREVRVPADRPADPRAGRLAR